MTKQLYLVLWASNQKNKTTLFPETLKVEENKVVLFFIKGPQMKLVMETNIKIWHMIVSLHFGFYIIF